jgi:hypothetical protein
MIKVYIASKLAYASRFRKFREEWKEENIDLHARWFDQAHIELNESPTPNDFRIFWMVDEEDVRTSDALILYAQEGDHLRGALVEAGIAIANKVLVIVVADHPDYGTWQWHPGVVHAGTFEHAKTLILRRFR